MTDVTIASDSDAGNLEDAAREPTQAEAETVETAEPIDPNVSERLAKLVAEAARVSTHPEEVTDSTSLLDDLDIDSILLVELIVNIETEFGIELLDEDVEIGRMIQFGSLAGTVANRISASRRTNSAPAW